MEGEQIDITLGSCREGGASKDYRCAEINVFSLFNTSLAYRISQLLFVFISIDACIVLDPRQILGSHTHILGGLLYHVCKKSILSKQAYFAMK
jgi:hypothetical protein